LQFLSYPDQRVIRNGRFGNKTTVLLHQIHDILAGLGEIMNMVN
jgi:hypothetical protein